MLTAISYDANAALNETNIPILKLS